MWLFNQASPATRISLTYITIGALTVVWTTVWFVFLYNHPPEHGIVYYVCTGFLITGIALLGIGFGLGSIGRASRPADGVAAQTSPTDAAAQAGTVVVPVSAAPALANGTTVPPPAAAIHVPAVAPPVSGSVR